MAQIRLTPQGVLRLETPTEDDGGAPVSTKLSQAFEMDWREGLFTLAAQTRHSYEESSTIRYWGDFASQYLTRLCQLPETSESFDIAPLSEADCATLVLTAPPMAGGEYLTIDALHGVWKSLDSFAQTAVGAEGGLGAFLHKRAPRWRQVGRVCFHLAENKADKMRPFAFMATYTSGLDDAGRPRHKPLRQALEEYAGARNRPALVKLLSPIHEASKKCDWVREIMDSGDMYRPMAWHEHDAYRFLTDADNLEESGLSVRLPDWWRKRPRPRVSVAIGESKKAALGKNAVLDFRVDVALGDSALTKEEIEELLAGEDGLVRVKGQWVEVDREKLREAIDHWQKIQQEAQDGEISFVKGMRLLAGASEDLQHEDLADEERTWAHVKAGKAMREILARLRDPAMTDGRMVTDDSWQANLRPYQESGLAWLHFVTELGLGACLADDMGLGKTVQVLALLERLRRQGKKDERHRSLLVIPASLLGNWRTEAKRFAPSLHLVFLHPAEADRRSLEKIAKAPAEQLSKADLVVTTYAMLNRQPWLADLDWRLVILDEAQAIKNPSTRQAKAVKRLPAQARIALTGTPVENRLGDLWSLFDFLNPGLLGSATVFQTFVKQMEARRRDHFAPLRRLVGPYILRRLKTDRSIISDLPEKTETTCYCHLTRQQAVLYSKIVEKMQETLTTADGMARRGLVLQTLMQLKQICNHPSQFSGDGDYSSAAAGKFQRMTAICEELAERQDKVLVFTQFREIIEPLARLLKGIYGRSGAVLHGATSVGKRQNVVREFQREDGAPFLILSLKAGGTGLNLTAASHVIHFDRWWNPAVENQATDRAFRIGQKRNVQVHKFVTQGTVEERIDALIEDKKDLAESVLSGESEVKLTELSDDELLRLVRLDATRATA